MDALSPREFWGREGTLLAVFAIFFAVWFVAATLIETLVELYADILGLPEPHTWLESIADDHQSATQYWPAWGWRVPTAILLIGYPIIFCLDAFQSTLQLTSRKFFGARR